MLESAGLFSAWLLGLSLGLTACTISCLPYMGAWVMARERSLVLADTSLFLAGRVSAYALLGLAAGLAGVWLDTALQSGKIATDTAYALAIAGRDEAQHRLAVHAQRVRVAGALWVQVVVAVVAGQAPADHLDAADLDDAVAAFGIQPGGLGVQEDLSHRARP